MMSSRYRRRRPSIVLCYSALWCHQLLDFFPSGSWGANAFILQPSSSFSTSTGSFASLPRPGSLRSMGASPATSLPRGRTGHRPGLGPRRRPPLVRLSASPFDMTRPVFDLYSFRPVRGDALAKYNSLNQSEPLRINLSLLAVLTLLASPWLVPEVLGTDSVTPAGWGGVVAGLAGSTGLLLRECRRRSNQLSRLEKELQAGELQLRVPANRFAGKPYATRPVSVAAWQGGAAAMPSSLPRRVLAVAAPSEHLRETLRGDLQGLGRRFVQASTLVVPIPTNDDDRAEEREGGGLRLRYTPWLAQAYDLPRWRAYFDGVISSAAADPTGGPAAPPTVMWFGLSATGRSFGSGRVAPSWLELFGWHLRPAIDLTETTSLGAGAGAGLPTSVDLQSDNDERTALEAQAQFYAALTGGNLVSMAALWEGSPPDVQVSSIVQQGGRLDNWASCLEEGARPHGLTVADMDVTLLSSTRACTTAVECPSATSFSSSGGRTATLLAVQHWVRQDAQSAWKLTKHQTIPWMEDVAAGGTLICDGRGCVSLVRSR